MLTQVWHNLFSDNERPSIERKGSVTLSIDDLKSLDFWTCYLSVDE